jgi:hypothetical protein
MAQTLANKGDGSQNRAALSRPKRRSHTAQPQKCKQPDLSPRFWIPDPDPANPNPRLLYIDSLVMPICRFQGSSQQTYGTTQADVQNNKAGGPCFIFCTILQSMSGHGEPHQGQGMCDRQLDQDLAV